MWRKSCSLKSAYRNNTISSWLPGQVFTQDHGFNLIMHLCIKVNIGTSNLGLITGINAKKAWVPSSVIPFDLPL